MTRRSHNSRHGFTLMEMMVAVALVVVVIIAVSMLTQSMGSMVSVSQASNELLSNVRAAEYRMERDVAGIDRSGFIAIRSRLVNGRRFDMISFIANGSYPNRTGTAGIDGNGNFTGLFYDSTSANAALVWYGQLALETATPPAGNGNYLAPDVTYQLPLGALPSGVKDTEFVLGRRAMLLMAATGLPASFQPPWPPATFVMSYPVGGSAVVLPAYASPSYTGATAVKATTNESAASVTSSRISIVSMTPSQLMNDTIQRITAVGGRSADDGARFEADQYCYRIHALSNVYGNDNKYAINYFRTHPQMLQGCSSFAVEWTDGTLDANQKLTWYGLGNPKSDATIEPAINVNNTVDGYTAIFSYDNKAKWPKALRMSYSVTDRNNRLNGGRVFSQVFRLPS